eukprot:6388672-Pyramimonas_sp.AAC.2
MLSKRTRLARETKRLAEGELTGECGVCLGAAAGVLQGLGPGHAADVRALPWGGPDGGPDEGSRGAALREECPQRGAQEPACLYNDTCNRRYERHGARALGVPGELPPLGVVDAHAGGDDAERAQHGGGALRAQGLPPVVNVYALRGLSHIHSAVLHQDDHRAATGAQGTPTRHPQLRKPLKREKLLRERNS